MTPYEVLFTIVLIIGAYGCHLQSKVIHKLQNDIRHLRKWAKATDDFFRHATHAHEVLARAHEAQDSYCKKLGTAVLSNQSTLAALTDASKYLAQEVDRLNTLYNKLVPDETIEEAHVQSEASPVTHITTRRKT